jgi:hypothetical protein
LLGGQKNPQLIEIRRRRPPARNLDDTSQGTIHRANRPLTVKPTCELAVPASVAKAHWALNHSAGPSLFVLMDFFADIRRSRGLGHPLGRARIFA